MAGRFRTAGALSRLGRHAPRRSRLAALTGLPWRNSLASMRSWRSISGDASKLESLTTVRAEILRKSHRRLAKPAKGRTTGHRILWPERRPDAQRYRSLTILWDHLAMRTRDDLRGVIDTLRERHSLLAAYLEAADRFAWRVLNKPMAIGELASVLDGAVSGRRPSELAGSNVPAAAA